MSGELPHGKARGKQVSETLEILRTDHNCFSKPQVSPVKMCCVCGWHPSAQKPQRASESVKPRPEQLPMAVHCGRCGERRAAPV